MKKSANILKISVHEEIRIADVFGVSCFKKRKLTPQIFGFQNLISVFERLVEWAPTRARAPGLVLQLSFSKSYGLVP